MSRLVLVTVPVVVLCALGLGGCQGGERAALPAGPTVSASPGPASPGPASPGSTSATARPGSGAAASPGSAGDPLAGIESAVDAVERDVGSDADSDAGSGGGSAPGR